MIKIKKNKLKQICFKSSLFVLLVVLCFCCFNLFVNADSLLTTDNYSKMSYFNWDSITISTDRGGESSTGYYPTNSIVFGSNDTNGQDIFNDFMMSSYDIESEDNEVPTDLTNYIVTVPSGWTASAGFGLFQLYFELNGFSYTEFNIGFDSVYQPTSDYIFCYNDNSNREFDLYNGESFSIHIDGGFGVTNPDLIQWFVDNNAQFLSLNSVSSYAIETIDYSIIRNVVKNETLSTTTHKCYDVELSSNVPIYQIIFEKNDFYIYSDDIRNGNIPYIFLTLLNQGYNISYTYDVSFLNNNNNLVSGYREYNAENLLNYQPLIPNLNDLLIAEIDSEENNLFYVKNLKVFVSAPNLNTSFTTWKYRYFVESESYFNEYYDGAKFTFANIESVSNLGDSLLQSVNAFMSFELVQGFSLMNILTLLVCIPLLVWILKMFLGG